MLILGIVKTVLFFMITHIIGYFLKPVQPLTLGLRLIAIAVAKFGIGSFPQAEYLFDFSLHWQNPGFALLLVRGMPGNDYLLTNSWAALLSGMLGISDPMGFHFFQLGLAIVALLSPFAIPSISLCPRRLWLLVMLLLAGPLHLVLLKWVGGYDPLSVIGAVIAVLARSSLASAMGWGLLALNHPSLVIVAWLCWLPMKLWLDRGVAFRQRLIFLTPSLAPITLGILVNHLFVQSWGGNTSRIAWLAYWDYGDYLINYASALPQILWSILGLGWLILLATSLIKLLETKILLLTLTLAGVLLPLVAMDETRVTSLAVLPLMLTYIRYVTIPKDIWLLRAGRTWFAMAAILLPTVLVFSRSGSLHGWSWVWGLFQGIS